ECAICLVSASAKKSATSGTNPARLAEAASARLDTAATSRDAPSAGKLLGKGVSVAEIEIDRFVRLDHLIEQAGLGLVFDVADRERPDTDGLGPRDRHAVVVHADALDAGRRHSVDVGGDEEVGRFRKLIGGE